MQKKSDVFAVQIALSNSAPGWHLGKPHHHPMGRCNPHLNTWDILLVSKIFSSKSTYMFTQELNHVNFAPEKNNNIYFIADGTNKPQ
jgi:hypothetical protein